MPDIGTAITGATAIGGAVVGSEGAKDAAATQAGAVDAASAAQERMFAQNRNDLAPWRTAGANALSRLSNLTGAGGTYNEQWAGLNDAYLQKYNEYQALSRTPYSPARDQRLTQLSQEVAQAQQSVARLTPESAANSGSLLKDFSLADFQADPSYEFRRNEGQRGIQNGAAAKGMQLSGATLKALNRYNSDLASQEYGAAYARDAANKERKFNMLSGIAGTGQAATNTTAALGANTASNMASLMTDRGNAMAAGQVGSANAWSGGISDAIGAYQQNQLLNRLFPSGSSSGGGGFTNPTAIGGANSLYVPRIA